MTVISINGELIDSKELGFPVDDAAYLYGYGCFETLLVHQGTPHLLHPHLRRLENALTFLSIDYAINDNEVHRSIHSLLSHHQLQDAILNIYVSAGQRMTPFSTFKSPKLIIKVRSHTPSIPSIRTTIQKELTPRNMYSAHKLMGYIPSILEQKRATPFTPILSTSEGTLLEAPTSSILLFQSNTLITIDHPHVLPSVTVPFCIDLLKNHGFSHDHRSVSVDQLCELDEILLINASGPQLIESIREIPHLNSGSNTQILVKEWLKLLYENL